MQKKYLGETALNVIADKIDTKTPISRTINGKSLNSNIVLSADDIGVYSKSEIDDMNLITVEDIDTICGTTILIASEVLF